MIDNEQPQRKSNVEIVTDFMQFGSPLKQVFVIAALDRYTKEVKAREAEIKADKNSLINGAAWVACAYDWEIANKS